MLIRTIVPDDTPALLLLTARTGVFKPMEIETLEEVLDDYHDGNDLCGHRAFLVEERGVLLGYIYHAPATMTDRTWYVYWIATAVEFQGRGIGSQLLRHAEQDIREHDGRVLFIETSSTPKYEATRRFYLKQGYELAAQLRDFYADGDDMIVFRKDLRNVDQR